MQGEASGERGVEVAADWMAPLPLGAIVRFAPEGYPSGLEARAGAAIAVLRCAESGQTGAVHALFPSSAVAPSTALRTPGLFADTGLDALLRLLQPSGSSPRRWRLHLVGSSRLGTGGPTHQLARGVLAAAVAWAVRRAIPIAEVHQPTSLARSLWIHPFRSPGGDIA